MKVIIALHHPDGDIAEYEFDSPEDAVAALLTLCHPTWIGKFKVAKMGMIQRMLMGIQTTRKEKIDGTAHEREQSDGHGDAPLN